ncbi:methylthioribulose 1-phosphate dehydratase [Frankia sp. CNm7]|uniref:Methylthioribulose-1-phosphate dehydratase n=1 Tax=Frankia nepalensis TaxID=1836974 RepID=A0A937RLM2_9ACTN|nr:methylthioribulose 1-phosphate dehydratase [Frankia nepalensis]MBL7499922.1 methylthioribulose 1-phosphate dehydratase [Frankia nepalensis]MBL7511715.1 methylthioribulose 1-phosphate dehydratase [Frankia nepalensis]MBL7523171.1 methylthioribulose 1-phosphate dehydratase [Frankia nepalensis]MBL7632525.1 methylthioribulose 1-phosphate dehydratase [Frankia nepalensis]
MTPPTGAGLAAAAAALAAEAARFAGLGWMRATSGNLSVVLRRDPLRLAVTASGGDKGELTAADVVEVDDAGRLVAAVSAARPSAEAALHARIAAVTGAGSVVHLHTLACVRAAARQPRGVEFAGLEMLKALGRPADGEATRLPVVANSQDMAVLGDAALAALEPGVPAFLVAGHGMYAWGEDLRAARRHAEAVDWLCALAHEA